MNDCMSIHMDWIEHPREYQPGLFVQRGHEMELIERKIHQAQTGGPILEPVINFWGIQGIGKTWLLKHLFQEYARPENTDGRSILALFYSIPNENWSPQEIVRSWGADIFRQISSKLSSNEKEQIQNILVIGEPQYLVDFLLDLSQRYVLVILLDNLQQGSPEFEVLEDCLIEPLAKTDRVLIIVTGRRYNAGWRRFEVRRRALSMEVRPFDRNAINQLIFRANYPIPEDALFLYTAGSPHLADVTARHMLTWEPAPREVPYTSLWIEEHRGQLLQILKIVETRLLESLSAEHRQAIQILAPLRFYRLEAFRIMLAKQYPPAPERPYGYYVGLLNALERQTGLIRWGEHRAYTTNQMVRQLINRRLGLDDPLQYIRQHRCAHDMYWQWMSESPNTSEDFIMEACFHLACLYLVEQNSNHLLEGLHKALAFANEHLNTDRFLVVQKQFEMDGELRDLLPADARESLAKELAQWMEQKQVEF